MRFLPSLFSIALFSSAFLSFSIQPILGKMLLPMVGGAPASWIVAMAFFQLALLAGYGISYFLGRFSPWMHAIGLIGLYVFGAYFLPPAISQISSDLQGVQLSGQVTKALFKTIFAPFLALTATTAALQRVFTATKDPTAKDPYYLFVASNAGSFAGLFIYPFLFEPLTGLSFQSSVWSNMYAVATILIVLSCLAAWRNKAKIGKVKKEKTSKKHVSAKEIIHWIILSFVPCSLSMGVTALITTDIGGLPLFWVIPLGLYLVTFIIAFSPKPILKKENADFYHVVAATFIVLFMGLEIGYQPTGDFAIFGFLAALLLGIFFFCAWACHQKLADSRPDPQHLALFYFIIALGGGLAGIIHAFILPFVLPGMIEFPIMVISSLWLVKGNLFSGKKLQTKKFKLMLDVLLGAAIIMLILGFVLRMHHVPRSVYGICTFIFLFCTLMLTIKPRYLMIIGVIALVTGFKGHYPGEMVERGRNFFGARAVYDIDVKGQKVRVFAHGNTMHGMEVMSADKKDKSDYSYYLQGGPIQDALDVTGARSMAIIGLGAGQVACYKPGALTIDYYEIDKAVEKVARNRFSYLSRCPVRDVVLGDGRIMLAKKNRKYDVILIDAFSSDGIPLHLITKEAIDTYIKQLNKNGLLLFHISNRYLNLSGPLAALGEAERLPAYAKLHEPKDVSFLKQKSIWFVISTDKTDARRLEKLGWHKEKPQAYVWTDDRSSMLSAFAWWEADTMVGEPVKSRK